MLGPPSCLYMYSAVGNNGEVECTDEEVFAVRVVSNDELCDNRDSLAVNPPLS